MAAAGTSIYRLLRRLRGVTKDAVFPTRCCGCSRFYRRDLTGMAEGRRQGETGHGARASLAEFLCDRCMGQTEPTGTPLCPHCGRPFDSPAGVNHLCGRCRRKPFEFSMARSAGKYDRALKALICIFKYDYRPELALPLARLLWQTLWRHWEPQAFDWIVPVPLHRRRLRQRGFNQAELLVRHWFTLAREQGLPFDRERLASGILIRHRYTPPQTGLDRQQRAANLKHAFKLTDPDAVQGRRVLLVDDVLTTGATANACARVLKKAKVASVKVLTLARAD